MTGQTPQPRSGRDKWRYRLRLAWQCLAVVFVVFSLLEALQYSLPTIVEFVAFGGDRARMESQDRIVRSAMHARMFISDHGCGRSSFTKWPDYYQVVLRYYLFPSKLKDSWQNDFNKEASCEAEYFINFHGQEEAYEGFDRIGLGQETELIALQGHFTPPRFQRPAPAFVTVLAIFIGYHLLIFLTGRGFTRLFLRDSPGVGWSGYYLFGFFLVSAVLWLTLSFGLTLDPSLVHGVLLSGLMLNWLMAGRGGERKAALRNMGAGPALSLLTVIEWCVVAFFAISVLTYPVGVWDELNIWLFKAKEIFHLGRPSFDYGDHVYNFYPLLWPIHLAAQYELVGSVSHNMVKLSSVLMFLCFIARIRQLAGALDLDKKAASVLIIVFLSCCFHWIYLTALPETAYNAFIVLAAGCFAAWLRQRTRGFLYLSYLALMGVCMIKWEGFIVMLCVMVAHLMAGRSGPRELCRRAVGLSPAMILVVLFYAMWLGWLGRQEVNFHAYDSGFFQPANLRALWSMIIVFLSAPKALAGVFLLAGYILLYRRSEWREGQQFLLVFVAGLVLASLFTGLRWPPGEFRLYYPEVLTRLFWRAVPVLLLLLASLAVKTERNVKDTDDQGRI